MRETLLALDAGGTKTDLLWAERNGTVLAHVQGEGMNIAATPPDAWQQTLQRLFRQAGVTPERVQVVCAGVAGYTLPDRRAQFQTLLQQLLPQAQVIVQADYAIALEGATGGEPGVLVIAGTGAIVCGRDAEGRLMRAGGWGYLLDDEGSGFWIAREAVRAALAAHEGWGRPTQLSEMVAEALGSAAPGEWLSRVYHSPTPQSLLAGWAPLVSRAAEQGDALAQSILIEAAQHLAERVVHLQAHLALPEGYPVCIVGGVWKAQTVREHFERTLRARLPHWQGTVQPPKRSPVEGALLIALRAIPLASGDDSKQ